MDLRKSSRDETTGGHSLEEKQISKNPSTATDNIQSDSIPAGGFNSFRVSMDATCDKVLAAALKKYQIAGGPDEYALWIATDDDGAERCLGIEEKPLELFKEMDKDGRKPMFILRRK